MVRVEGGEEGEEMGWVERSRSDGGMESGKGSLGGGG